MKIEIVYHTRAFFPPPDARAAAEILGGELEEKFAVSVIRGIIANTIFIHPGWSFSGEDEYGDDTVVSRPRRFEIDGKCIPFAQEIIIDGVRHEIGRSGSIIIPASLEWEDVGLPYPY